VAADPKQINVISTYQMDIIAKIQSALPNVTGLCFNKDDSVLAATSSDGTAYRYNMFTFKRLNDSIIDRESNFTSSMFLDIHGDRDNARLIYVGSCKNPQDKKKEGGLIRINDIHDVTNFSETLQDQTPQLALENKATHKTRPLFRDDNPVLQVNGVCKIAPHKGLSPEMAGLTSIAIGTNRGTINLMGMYPDQIGTDKLH
jgi:hypothetical protein